MEKKCTECNQGPCYGTNQKCLDEELKKLGQGATTDWYGQGENVSMEEAAETEERNKRAIDKGVEDENRFGSAKHDTRPPCQKRKGSSHS